MAIKKQYIVIACEVIYRELCAAAAENENPVDLHFVRQALHSMGSIQMPIELQAIIDTIDTSQYEAILLGYGLCNNGTCGLVADIPIVIPRAHDCITLLMGSKEMYRDFFDKNPGTMYSTSGWSDLTSDFSDDDVYSEAKYQEFVELYGEDAAEYVKETLFGFEKHYHKYCFINTGVGSTEQVRQSVIHQAQELGWEFEEIHGSDTLFKHLISGNWLEEEFIVIEPGHIAKPSYHDDIFKQEAVS